MRQSRISWCDLSSGDFNLVTGCTPVSPGCDHCYARAIYHRYDKDFSQVQTHEDKLTRLLKVKRWPEVSRRGAGHKPLVFICDTGDLFHPSVPASFIIFAFDVMAAQTAVDWAVLTKRPERIREVLFGKEGDWYLGGGDYIPNIWLGVTAENQAMADERIPYLEEWQGIRWVSVEPMLGPVDLSEYLLWETCAGETKEPRPGTIGGQPYRVARMRPWLQWVVCGAESGAQRRAFDVGWALELASDCTSHGVPVFYKQGSGVWPGMHDELPGCGQVHEWPESIGQDAPLFAEVTE
jgi:protein gp37